MRTRGLTHVAMSVPVGTLTAAFRAELLGFYAEAFGWRELARLSTADRLTIAIGPGTYLNVREHETPMAAGAYEHFGVLVDSAEEVARLHEAVRHLGADPEPIEEPVPGHPTFRFRHLLPMAIEVQFVPPPPSSGPPGVR
jgi:hypothetical protein